MRFLKHLHRPLLTTALAVCAMTAGGPAAQACNVPVFRYALEHWRPDAYRVTLLHRGPLDDVAQKHLDKLAAQAELRLVNVKVRTLDVDDVIEPADQVLLASLKEPQLPLLVMQYPAHLRQEKPVWTGPIDSVALKQLIESPLRKELVRRVIEGQATVWLLLESGDAEKDNAAAALLQEELKTLPLVLKLPELTDSPEDVLLGGPPLRLAFSMLRVPRSEVEDPLVSMLLDSESDLRELADPQVFPVFGRGRALLPLVGAGITLENIRGTAAFLTGACSCQVKEQNPGFDLLLAANWEELLSMEGVSLTTLGSEPSSKSSEPELVPIAGGSQTTPMTTETSTPHQPSSTSDRKAGSPSKSLLIGAFVLVLAMFLLVRRR